MDKDSIKNMSTEQLKLTLIQVREARATKMPSTMKKRMAIKNGKVSVKKNIDITELDNLSETEGV